MFEAAAAVLLLMLLLSLLSSPAPPLLPLISLFDNAVLVDDVLVSFLAAAALSVSNLRSFLLVEVNAPPSPGFQTRSSKDIRSKAGEGLLSVAPALVLLRPLSCCGLLLRRS